LSGILERLTEIGQAILDFFSFLGQQIQALASVISTISTATIQIPLYISLLPPAVSVPALSMLSFLIFLAIAKYVGFGGDAD
jgi:hypothetical protein